MKAAYIEDPFLHVPDFDPLGHRLWLDFSNILSWYQDLVLP